MQLVFATYNHHCIGFPRVILKWTEENGEVAGAYVTVGDVISRPWNFSTVHNPKMRLNYTHECELFDKWVRERYGNDPTVQG